MKVRRAVWGAALAAWALGPLATPSAAGEWQFVEVAAEAGFTYEHGFGGLPMLEPHHMSGGVAAGDFDRDGFTDLFVVRGVAPHGLFRNRGDGTFEDVATVAGVAGDGELANGPAFGDFNGDGWPDLVLGGIAGAAPRLYRNLSDGTFEDVTAVSGVISSRDTFSTSFGDYDRDGDLDLFQAHWSPSMPGLAPAHLWRNNSDGTFSPIDWTVGIGQLFQDSDYSFTANFADIDGDRWPDILLASDFGTSQVLRNRADGTFEVATTAVISDENGMGTAIGDYDNDGDLDWFVSSIWDPDGVAQGNWGITGNRLYRNLGDGTFEDATDEAGVRQGFWGWGACFGDFDNDGHLDLFHTNGFSVSSASEFHQDPARMFIGNGDGTFTERSSELDLDHPGQGRGVVCFDYDRDGDLDIFVANNSAAPLLYRNDGGEKNAFLSIELQGQGGNQQAVGAEIRLTTLNGQQMRHLEAGSHYLSQDPIEAHFGLANLGTVDRLEIHWPNGDLQVLDEVETRRRMTIVQGSEPTAVPEIPLLDSLGLCLLGLTMVSLALSQIQRGNN